MGYVTVAAQKVTDLRIENNHLESDVNLSNRQGTFVHMGVIDIRERVVKQDPNCGSGAVEG